MDLEEIVKRIQEIRLNDSDAALKNIASSEKYLEQSYEGRYLFELIQNVRDANKEANMTGSIFIELKEDCLVVSNTGAPFTEKGINSITTIGDSSKESLEFIGYKGIGFKSVCEVTDRPKVETTWGSLIFDKEKTKPLVIQRNFRDREIPLFFIPHYGLEKLTESETKSGIVTKVILPLKKNLNVEEIYKTFKEIGVHQILLLGSLENIYFSSDEYRFKFNIRTDPSTGKVQVIKNEEIFLFKLFKPSVKIPIPKVILRQLDDQEKEMYDKEPFIDISLVFDLDERNIGLIARENCKLFLYYPTEIPSGFNFIIHSHFLVTPDRKGLRNNILNKYILKCISDYLAGEWLIQVKKNHKNSFINLLAFSRNKEATFLKYFYDRLVKNLKKQKIMYDKETRRFYKSNEVVIADGFDKGLFPDNQINGKRLIYINNSTTKDWLIKEIQIDYLSFETIAENIERECARQKKKRNVGYFENLYKYLVDNDDLNLRGKNILLTSKFKVLSSNDDVFYGFKEKIEFPDSIQQRINFIHPKVKISEQRLGKGQTGFKEYSTELLVNRLLNLYDEKEVPPLDILVSLFKLKITERLLVGIKRKILLPIISGEWVNPFSHPLYIESKELRLLYPSGKFIDYDCLMNRGIAKEVITERLLLFGAWDIPAIYFTNDYNHIGIEDPRFLRLREQKWFSTNYFTISGDWKLDFVDNPNHWYTETIINNWHKYIKVVEDENNPTINYKSQSSGYYPLPKNIWRYVISLTKYLQDERWIVLNEDFRTYKRHAVIGVDPIELAQSNSAILKKYMNPLPLQYSYNRDFISLVGFVHLDSTNIVDFKDILLQIHANHAEKIKIDKEFISFYNRILSKLFDCYSNPSFSKNDIAQLDTVIFLGTNETDKTLDWKPSNQIYYIEDKPSYEILPLEIKKIIQPQFTTRNKNKFGQIAKRIGLDFKKVFVQRIENVLLKEEIEFKFWLPHIAESLAFIEVLLETNIDKELKDIKASVVKVCQSFSVILLKDNNFIKTLDDVPHKISGDDPYTVFVLDNPGIKRNVFYANVLNDLLVDVLERDLGSVRISLVDFFSQSDIASFVEKYEVPPDRIEEIKARFTDFTMTKYQSFWYGIILAKEIMNPSSYIRDNTMDWDSLSLESNIQYPDQIRELDDQINFEELHCIENIKPLASLFDNIHISIEDYNKYSSLKIDFRFLYLKQLEGLKEKLKPIFTYKLHHYLSNRDLNEKSEFQNMIDQYSAKAIVEFEGPVLDVNVVEDFLIAFNQRYPYLQMIEDDLSCPTVSNFLETYRKNDRLFKRELVDYKNCIQILDDFLVKNSNRSLLYFENTLGELVSRFKSFYETVISQNLADDQNQIDLSLYLNSPDLKIKHVEPQRSSGHNSRNNPNEFPIGKRIDGGRQNSTQNLMAIVSEKAVYDILKTNYPTTSWISKNAAKAGINPEGSDVYGCDIIYVDENNQKHYIEVKSNTADQKHFFVSFPEFDKSIHEGEYYHFFVVLYVFDNEKREILDLGNIFNLDENSDVFNNKKFTANFNSLEITFK